MHQALAFWATHGGFNMCGKCIGLVTEQLELICILTKSEFVVLQYIYHTLVIVSNYWSTRTQNSANSCQMLTNRISELLLVEILIRSYIMARAENFSIKFSANSIWKFWMMVMISNRHGLFAATKVWSARSISSSTICQHQRRMHQHLIRYVLDQTTELLALISRCHQGPRKVVSVKFWNVRV